MLIKCVRVMRVQGACSTKQGRLDQMLFFSGTRQKEHHKFTPRPLLKISRLGSLGSKSAGPPTSDYEMKNRPLVEVRIPCLQG